MMKLSELKFSDMYLDPERPQEALMRGLLGDDGLSSVPDVYLKDLKALSGKLLAENIQTPEFIFDYDGCRFRGAFISQGLNSSGNLFYCLRKSSSENLETLWEESPFAFKNMMQKSLKSRGILLFSGSFSTGKTRNASIAIDYWARQSKDVVVTLEDPPEYNIDRRSGKNGIIIQTNVTGGRLNDEIFNMRRWVPRYVFFGEVRTPSMAAALLHMSISGPLCLATVHSSSASRALFSLLHFASEAMEAETARDILGASICGIVHHNRVGNKFTPVCHDFQDKDSVVLRAKIRNGRQAVVEEEITRRFVSERLGKS